MHASSLRASFPEPQSCLCREGMSRGEAESLVKQAVSLAMSRDGSSGGVVRMVTIDKEGSHRSLLLPEDLSPAWDEGLGGGRPGSIV